MPLTMNIKTVLFIRFCVAYASSLCDQPGNLTTPKQEEIISLLEECLVLALFLDDYLAPPVIYRTLGDLYRDVRQVAKASECYEKLSSFLFGSGIKNTRKDIVVRYHLAIRFESLRKYDKAIEYLEKSLSIAKAIGEREWEAAIYQKLGHEYRSLEKYNKAIECHEMSLCISRDIRSRKKEQDAYVDLGNVHYSLANQQKAMEYYEKGLSIAKNIGDKKGEGRIYGNLGCVYSSLRNYHKAEEYYEKSLGIAQEIGDKKGESTMLSNLGVAYLSKGKYHQATECLERTVKIDKETGDLLRDEVPYYNLGNAYQSLWKNDKAIENHERSLSIAKEIGDRRREGLAYRQLANVYQVSGEYHKAIECYEKRLDIAKEIGDRQGEATTYGNLGNVYGSLGKYNKAIEYHEKSIGIAKENGYRYLEGRIYVNLGSVYQTLGKHNKAIECHEKGLVIAKEVDDRQGEGMTYGKLGNAYQSLGEYGRANDFLQMSLGIAKDTGHKEGETIACGSLGEFHFLIGENHRAIEYYEMMLKIAEEIGSRQAEGTALQSLGNCYLTSGEWQKSIEYNEKSLKIAKEIGNREGEGISYGNLGNAYQFLNEHQKAIQCYEHRLDISREIGDRKREGNAYANLGNVYSSLGEYHKAIECYEKSLSIAKEIGNRQGEASAHHNLGFIYQKHNSIRDISQSKEHLKSSITCHEMLFQDLKENDQFKISIVETFIKTFQVLNQVLIEAGETNQALLVCERRRARALGDLLSCKYSTIDGATLKDQTAMELDDISAVLMSSDTCILFYNIHYIKHIANMWVIAPETEPIFFYDERVQPEALREISWDMSEGDGKDVKNGNFKLLVENSFQYMGIREGMKCEDRSLGLLECEDNDFKTALNPKRNAMDDESCRWMQEAECEEDVPLEMLFDRLVAPVLNKLTKDEIIIIPDGPLFMLPFAALQDPKTGKFLSESKRIRLAPSLTTLKILQESSDDNYSKSGALIIGNPATGKVMYKGKQRSITSLPGAENESKEIGKLLGVQPLIGEHATKERVLAELKRGVSVIHFAAHGCEENGQIFLAPSQPSTTNNIPEEKDYILTMKEAQDSGIRAQLVVLSCCHTGRGEIKSEGVVGMTRAFLAAGARSVVASLWAIADEATMLFMVKFYSHLKNGESASTSLQQAMKEMRETEKYKEPKYWAAFFLIGDDVTIKV